METRSQLMSPDPLYVTQSYLPPFDEFVAQMQRIWQSGQLTNNGPLVVEYEDQLKKRLGVKHIFTVDNGDAGLRVAYKAMELSGSVVTTPFSYVSTTSSLLWSGLTPIFADIDPETLTIDPQRVAESITEDTSAILATHVFGNPCDVNRLQEVADEHKLWLIYDAAHAFGVTYNDSPILSFGDVSMISLHATKIVHSGEGGLLATNDDELASQIEWRRRFGHDGTESFHGVGINAKMSELHAGLGLCVLHHYDTIVALRRKAAVAYDTAIDDLKLPISKPTIRPKTVYNSAYYPILLESESTLIRVIDYLNQRQIFPRRYFYPSLNTVATFGHFPNMPISESVSARALCLPFSATTTEHQIRRVTNAISEALRK